MSIYVMSDIHGHFDEFNKMLELISFSDDDELVIAGDYVDRGPKTLEMLKWLEDIPDNVLTIKGNHDAEFSQCISILANLAVKSGCDLNNQEQCETVYDYISELPNLKSAYFDYYGTIGNLIKDRKVTISDLIRWAALIDDMPFTYKRTVNDIKHVVVHAGYYEDDKASKEDLEQFYLYAREESITKGGIDNGVIIAGHTPTIIKGQITYAGGEVFCYHDNARNCTYYDIDCGAGYMGHTTENVGLACIRLEDKEIFYIR